MRAYDHDLRKRIVEFVEKGGSKTEAARLFGVGRHSVHRYVNAAREGRLKPKTTWGSWRKLDPEKLRAFINEHPDSTLHQMAKIFAVSHNGIWACLKKLAITLKKTRQILGKKRTRTLAVPKRNRAA